MSDKETTAPLSARDKIRNATMGKTPEFKNVIKKYNGVDVEFRQPTIRSRNTLNTICSKVNKEDGTVTVDVFEFLVWAVIQNTFVPGTNEKVYEASDYDSLVENPAGGFMDEFGAIAAELVNVDKAAIKKGSKTPQTSN